MYINFFGYRMADDSSLAPLEVGIGRVSKLFQILMFFSIFFSVISRKRWLFFFCSLLVIVVWMTLYVTGQFYSIDSNAEFGFTPGGRYTYKIFGEGISLSCASIKSQKHTSVFVETARDDF